MKHHSWLCFWRDAEMQVDVAAMSIFWGVQPSRACCGGAPVVNCAARLPQTRPSYGMRLLSAVLCLFFTL